MGMKLNHRRQFRASEIVIYATARLFPNTMPQIADETKSLGKLQTNSPFKWSLLYFQKKTTLQVKLLLNGKLVNFH